MAVHDVPQREAKRRKKLKQEQIQMKLQKQDVRLTYFNFCFFKLYDYTLYSAINFKFKCN